MCRKYCSIKKRFKNIGLDECIEEILEYIKQNNTSIDEKNQENER